MNEIVEAINNLQPGDEVAYGNQNQGRSLGLEEREDETARNAAHRVAGAGRGMLFHRRVGNGHNYVIRGVKPTAKQAIEDFVEKLPNEMSWSKIQASGLV